MRTQKSITLIVFLFLVFALSACGTAAATTGLAAQAQATLPAGAVATQPAIRTLNVSGTGKATLTPDIAYINIGVHTEGKDAAEAVSSNNSQSQKVVDALKKMGIDAKDIRTTNFSIYPRQDYDPQNKPLGITYMVDNTVYVTVRDLTKVGDLLDTSVKAGANSISGIQFDVADKNAAMSDARKGAVADAKAQAEELAKAAGVTLGNVQSISTNQVGVPVPMAYGLGAGAMKDAAASVPISSGQMTITVDVNIVYEIH
ncbi:MAG TPA: SIMPL domain-containing protein [Anaerolineales bacterium]